MSTTKYLIGSVSSGTMRPEDLLPAFADLLAELDTENRYESLREDCDSYRVPLAEGHLNDDGIEAVSEIIGDLFDALNDYAAPYMYFGAHPGDGSDYGFWVSESLESDFDGLKVSDLSEVPDDYSGEVLHVNDHGNVSLYAADNGKLTEIWEIV